jgi:hypothetical protein
MLVYGVINIRKALGTSRVTAVEVGGGALPGASRA